MCGVGGAPETSGGGCRVKLSGGPAPIRGAGEVSPSRAAFCSRAGCGAPPGAPLEEVRTRQQAAPSRAFGSVGENGVR